MLKIARADRGLDNNVAVEIFRTLVDHEVLDESLMTHG